MKTILKQSPPPPRKIRQISTFLSAVILSLLVFTACQKSAISPIEENTIFETKNNDLLPKNQNGLLIFTNQNQFQQFNNYVLAFPAEGKDYSEALKDVGDFYSYAMAYEDIHEDDHLAIVEAYMRDGSLAGFENLITIMPDEGRELQEVEVVVIPTMRHFLNKDAMIQIGDLVYKFLFYQVISVKASDEAAVEALKNLNESTLPSFYFDYETEPIEREVIQTSTAASRGIVQHYDCITVNPNDSKYRVKGEVAWSNYSGSQGYSLETKHQKKTAGIWFGNEVDQVGFHAFGYVEWGSTHNDRDFWFNKDYAKTTGSIGFEDSFCGGCLRGDADVKGFHTSSEDYGDCYSRYLYEL
ncbi:MAG: hypothetical protein R3D00_19685 [Bacteroidia bacterium]